MKRAELGEMDYTVKDARAKALTDAKKAGYDIKALQVAGVHADRSTTEGYIKQREVPVSTAASPCQPSLQTLGACCSFALFPRDLRPPTNRRPRSRKYLHRPYLLPRGLG